MTNIEYEEFKFFLETFTIGEQDHPFNYLKMNEIGLKSYYFDGNIIYANLMDSISALMNEFYVINPNLIIYNLNLFKLEVVNPEQKQLFYTGTSFNRVKHLLYKTGATTFQYEIYGSESYMFLIDLGLESIFYREKRFISPHSIYEYFEQNLSWDVVFKTTPLIVNNDYFYSEVTKVDTSEGYFINQQGRNYYMTGHPEYERQIPFVSYQFYLNNPQTLVSFSLGYNGSVENFIPMLSMAIYEYGYGSLFNAVKKANFSLILMEEEINQSKTLQSWIDLIETKDITYEEYDGFSKQEMMNKFTEIFNSYLTSNIVLPSVINPTIS
jgi:hypothetical protein